jgi:ParB family chromosome partitioning protein
MDLEFHQLDLRFEHLRVRRPERERRLLASLAATGQQVPIVVVAVRDKPDRYLVIDGYKRVSALRRLGRDTVRATVWPMDEAEALLLGQSLRASEGETALEQGWLLAELEQRFGYSLDELARRFDRSRSWVSRRLALVELLPDPVQQKVREGKIAPHVAMKFLVPVARANLSNCEQMAGAFATHQFTSREAGELYAAWRDASLRMRSRILEEPALFLKARREIGKQQPEADPPTTGLLRDLEMVSAIAHRASRRWRQTAALMDGVDLDRAHHCLQRAMDELSRLARRIEQEKPHAGQKAAHDDPRTLQPGNEDTADCQGTADLPAGRPERDPFEIGRSALDPPPRACGTIPGTDPTIACLLQRQPGPGS